MNPSTIVKPCNEKTFQQGNIYCLYNSEQITHFTPELFSIDYWQQQQAVVGSAQGRGTTWFIRSQEHAQEWVLKHYYRGGLIGKLNKDYYFFTNLTKTRAIQEFKLLNTLQQLSLPAPIPVACQIIRHKLSYQANLLTTRITNAQDLVGILSQQTINQEIWQSIGACIQRFHQAGIYHDDLNCHNILLDSDNKIWLIDFDRGEQRPINHKWQQANLARLLRSFQKEHKRLPAFYWSQQSWQYLLEGYLSQ